MAADAADRNLLFGLLALQNGLIDQDQLVTAFRAWIRDKSRPIADRGDLDPDEQAAVAALVALHLKKHGNDPEKSLVALTAGGSTRESLGTIGDPDVEASLAHVRSRVDGDVAQTHTLSLGTATSDGQRFRVLRPHAFGGLGAVFVALDQELHREVALKEILDSHADDPVSRSRFVLEAEITGDLEHPGIAPVYGLGTYAGGRPYYAMRFIRGDSLKEAIERFHADEELKHDPGRRSLELRKLLRRFTDVCNAIGYAHSRGVLHRDIKPGNVIVGKHGETLVVDWGLAKVLGRRDPDLSAGERTLVPSSASGIAETLPGSAIGTPAYMSPEQAAGDVERLGPRSDVYCLGATLYCLLTGRPPFQGKLDDVLRTVQRGEFSPPRKLDPSIDPALEAVCLEATAFRPEDRYATPKALTEDVERWMADEAVTAWREPLTRRARRWMRRNRAAVTGVAAALVAGVIGLSAVVALQTRANAKLNDAYAKLNDAYADKTRALIETREAKKATELALADTRAAKNATDDALAASDESRRQAEAVSKFLVESFRSPDPSLDGRKVTVADLLDRAVETLGKEFTGSGETRGTLLDALGSTYRGLGLYDKAVATHEESRAACKEALGPDHSHTLTSSFNLATAYVDAGRTAEAIVLYKGVLDLRESKLGFYHPDTLTARIGLAFAYDAAGRTGDAITLGEATLKLAESQLGSDHPDTLATRNNLAQVYLKAGRVPEAIRLDEVTLQLTESKLGRDNPRTLTSRSNLAQDFLEAGRIPEAIRLDEVTLQLRESKLGPDHSDTLSSRNNLAQAYRRAGRITEAIRVHEATLKLCETKYGPNHHSTMTVRNNLASAYLAHGRAEEAIRMHQGTLKLLLTTLDPDHPITLTCRNNLAFAYYTAGRSGEAIALYESLLPAQRTVIGPSHSNTLIMTNSFASAYESVGRWAEAEPLRRELIARIRETEKLDSPLASQLAGLGLNLLKQAKWPEAEPVLRDCLAIREKALAEDWSRFNAMSMLGGALLGQDKYAEAEPLVVPGYEGMKARAARIPATSKSRLSEAAEQVVRLYEAWDKVEQAAAWKAKLGLADLPADVFAK